MQILHDATSLQKYAKQFGMEDILTDEVRANTRLVFYPAGEMLMQTGDVIEQMLFLVEGTLRVYSLSENGKLGIVALAEPPQMLGDIEHIRGVNALHSVMADTDATLIAIPIADVHKHLSSNIAFYRMICNNLVEKLYKTSGEYSRALLYPAKNRFARYLLDRMDDKCLVRFSSGEAAQNLGITARHMSRLISELEREGILCREKPKTLRVMSTEALLTLSNF